MPDFLPSGGLDPSTFLPDGGLDVEQAWADAANSTAVMTEEEVLGHGSYALPGMDSPDYTSGHVRTDHLDLDENGFVKDGTLDPGFSGQEYVKKKLEAKGFKEPCCGSCAGGGSCEGGCGGGCSGGCGGKSHNLSMTPASLYDGVGSQWGQQGVADVEGSPWTTTAVPLPDTVATPVKDPVSEQVDDCCCCVLRMCVSWRHPKHMFEEVDLFDIFIPLRRRLILTVDVDFWMRGVGTPVPCKMYWLERPDPGITGRPTGWHNWDPNSWNDAFRQHRITSLWGTHGVDERKKFEEEQEEACPGLGSNTKVDPIIDRGSSGEFSVWIFVRWCSSCPPERCMIRCCCAAIRVKFKSSPSRIDIESILGPICVANEEQCADPDLRLLRAQFGAPYTGFPFTTTWHGPYPQFPPANKAVDGKGRFCWP